MTSSLLNLAITSISIQMWLKQFRMRLWLTKKPAKRFAELENGIIPFDVLISVSALRPPWLQAATLLEDQKRTRFQNNTKWDIQVENSLNECCFVVTNSSAFMNWMKQLRIKWKMRRHKRRFERLDDYLRLPQYKREANVRKKI